MRRKSIIPPKSNRAHVRDCGGQYVKMSATEIKAYLDENRLQCCEDIELQKSDANYVNRRMAYHSRNRRRAPEERNDNGNGEETISVHANVSRHQRPVHTLGPRRSNGSDRQNASLIGNQSFAEVVIGNSSGAATNSHTHEMVINNDDVADGESFPGEIDVDTVDYREYVDSNEPQEQLEEHPNSSLVGNRSFAEVVREISHREASNTQLNAGMPISQEAVIATPDCGVSPERMSLESMEIAGGTTDNWAMSVQSSSRTETLQKLELSKFIEDYRRLITLLNISPSSRESLNNLICGLLTRANKIIAEDSNGQTFNCVSCNKSTSSDELHGHMECIHDEF